MLDHRSASVEPLYICMHLYCNHTTLKGHIHGRILRLQTSGMLFRVLNGLMVSKMARLPVEQICENRLKFEVNKL